MSHFIIWIFLGFIGMIISYTFNIQNYKKYNFFVNFIVFIIGILCGVITLIEITYKTCKK